MSYSHLSRRNFLELAGLGLSSLGLAGWVPSLSAVEPIKRQGHPRLLLSLAAYSFRNFFRDSNRGGNAPPPAKSIDMFDFVDYCAEHGCQGAEVTSYYFPKDVDQAWLLRLRRHAFLRGIALSGTAVGNEFTSDNDATHREQIAGVKTWIDRAQVLGTPHIRIFAGNAPAGSKARAMKQCIAAIQECADYAGSKGIFLGLENHGGIVAESSDILEIIKAVNSPWVGINLDSGNFHSADPYAELELCVPYAVNVQFKVEIQRQGQKKEESDLARVVKILCDANYQGYFALEYEAAADPWKAVPEWLEKMRTSIGG
jgi:sugar phosphate isomerase/epimerase